MNMTRCLTATLALLLIAPSIPAQDQKAKRAERGEPPVLEGAQVETYKTIGDVKLNIYIYNPAGHQATDNRPAIVFFFGGGWYTGSPKQFEQHCKYFASRGMVAMTADYRVFSRHQTAAIACVKDGKSAIRWVRANARRLGVDPNHVAAGGGSAGGHVAACLGVIKGLDEEGEDTAISSAPNAMALFNPALALAPVEGRVPFGGDVKPSLKVRMGIEPIRLSPFHNVHKGAPPAIVFHGKADTMVPYWTAEVFTKAMKEAGNRCELAGSDGQQHGFFNFGRGDGKSFIETVRKADEFLATLGFLKGKPTIQEFAKGLK